MFRYILYRLLEHFMGHVPESIGYPAFELIADIIDRCAPRTHALVMANMRRMLGANADEKLLRTYTQEAFRNLLCNYYAMFHMQALSPADIKQRVHVAGMNHLEMACQGGHGGVVVFPHSGNLEMMMQVPLLYPGIKFLVLVEHMEDERLFRLMRRLRMRHGLEIIPATQLLRIVRLLKQGWVALIAGDLDSTHSGIIVNYFGAQARIPDGAVQLALRTGAPLLVAYGWQEAGARGPQFQVRILPPLAWPRTGDFPGDVRRGVELVVCQFEKIIAARPGQWLAFHKFWLES
jgi:KDO2-lipid IV(A) lauroyltransferase